MPSRDRKMEFLKAMVGDESPEIQEWFLRTYGEDPEFAKVVDRFHFNLLSLQTDMNITS